MTNCWLYGKQNIWLIDLEEVEVEYSHSFIDSDHYLVKNQLDVTVGKIIVEKIYNSTATRVAVSKDYIHLYPKIKDLALNMK